MFGFDKALQLIKEGKKVKRAHWGGYWFLDTVDTMEVKNFKMIGAKLKDGGYAPATPYQEDLLAEDWSEVE